MVSSLAQPITHPSVRVIFRTGVVDVGEVHVLLLILGFGVAISIIVLGSADQGSADQGSPCASECN